MAQHAEERALDADQEMGERTRGGRARRVRIARPDVVRLQGSIGVEQTLAKMGADRSGICCTTRARRRRSAR